MKLKWGLLTFVIIILLVLLKLITIGSEEKQKQQVDEVTLQLKWINQAQFAGYYIAQEKGYYEEENLKVNILPGGVDINPVDQLKNGSAEFAVAASEVIIQAYAQNSPLEVIAVIFQKNPFVLITLADSGIESLKDFEGKSLGISNITGEDQFMIMAKNTNIDINTVEMVEFTMDFDQFYNGSIDIFPAFSVGSYLDVVRDGIQVNEFWPDDFGVHWYSDTIIVNKSFSEQNPEIVGRFLRATIKGMQFMVTNPEESVSIVMKYADLQNEQIQRDMLYSAIPLMYNGEIPIGWMEKERWDGIIADLQMIDQIETTIESDQFLNFSYLYQIYGPIE